MARLSKPISPLSASDKLRFFAKVSITPTDNGCLEWLGSLDRGGYGHFKLGVRPTRAHRIAYLIANSIDPGLFFVCHSCDNPKCVNPEHLFLGTNKDNMRDKEKKGRGNQPRGEKHHSRLDTEWINRGQAKGCAKLTSTDVTAIRADGRSQCKIAADYGVDRSQISLIKNFKSWRHVA